MQRGRDATADGHRPPYIAQRTSDTHGTLKKIPMGLEDGCGNGGGGGALLVGLASL
jgi:hypothetical protein